MTSSSLDPQLRNRLTRFIHTGNEIPKYFPGCWTAAKYFEIDSLQVITDALENRENHAEVIDIILQAYKNGWYTRFETIAFAFTKCLLVGPPAVKEATYKAAVEISKTEDMMFFNKFTRLFQTGNGRGWCRYITEWYLSKDPLELAKEVTRVRARYGRSHKILMKKSHVKVDRDHKARDAIVKYVIFGLKRAKQMIDCEETKEIYDYIQKVEDFRHCEDPVAAADMVTQNHFTLDHVPAHLLTTQDIWDAILPEMPLDQLLYNIQRVHNMGFLTNESTTTAVLLSLLNNKDVVQKSKVTPLEVYITLCNYKKKSKPLKYEKAKVVLERQQRRRTRQIFDTKTQQWEWAVSRRHPKEVKFWGIDHPPNPAILAALNKLIDQTWLLTEPTNQKYLITMDMRHNMFKGRHFCKNFIVTRKAKKAAKAIVVAANTTNGGGGGDTDTETKESKKHLHAECFYNKNVTPGHAAIVLALQLLKREKNVKLAVFTDDGVQLVTIERNFSSIEEAEFVFRKANLGKVQLDAPIEWATKTNQKFDVFINMVDRVSRYMELDIKDRGGRGPGGRYGPPPSPEKKVADHCPVRALERYRNSSGIHDAKLIVMSLASHRVGTTDGSHEGVLDIIGIDEHVPKVIDAFVRGEFK
ncbi:RNA-binding protein RO60 isoform X2 [Epargyreus clarus]|uniref:RNA-binding protein RO60 isoform X2 n=1 Tax=Epargyreus clarus TaxID=520877 RepID=UPI003C2CC493